METRGGHEYRYVLQTVNLKGWRQRDRCVPDSPRLRLARESCCVGTGPHLHNFQRQGLLSTGDSIMIDAPYPFPVRENELSWQAVFGDCGTKGMGQSYGGRLLWRSIIGQD